MHSKHRTNAVHFALQTVLYTNTNTKSSINKSVFSLVHTLVVNKTAQLAFAAERHAAVPLLLGTWRPPLLTDISCLHGAQQQTHLLCILREQCQQGMQCNTTACFGCNKLSVMMYDINAAQPQRL